jgi:hypothetical protein
MKRLLGFLLLLPLVTLTFPTYTLSTTRGIRVSAKQGQSLYLYKDYHALVVGISDYEKWPDLPNAAKDAREVAANLKGLGFSVKLVLDPTSNEMRSALSDVVYTMGNEKNRALLFYYAGHGETQGLADGTELGYIIPRDCPLKSKDPIGFDNKAVSMKDIEMLALKVKSKHFLMVFDSCFSGSLFNLVRAAPVDISEKSALPVRQFITAGGAGEEVPDQSVFKEVFLRGVSGDADLNDDGYVTGSELGMHLQERVVNYTRGGQHPQYGKINNPKLDRGDFIFVPTKVSEKEMAQEQGLQGERAAIAEELEKLREERKKSEELVEEMRRLLEAKWQSEEKAEKSLAQKRDLEKELGQLKDERQMSQEQTDAKLRSLQAQQTEAEEKLREETAEKKALEEEVNRLKAQMAASSRTVQELEGKQAREERLAHIPKEVKEAKIQSIRLRSSPGPTLKSDVRDMVAKHNFFIKKRNENGDFPNHFVDNGDGTVTDRVTGLMWEKGGSSKPMFWNQVKRYVSRLNKERFLGHDDWRVPTLEELASLLEPKVNAKRKHIDNLFKGKQKLCWSSDFEEGPWATKNYVVNFAAGSIDHRRSYHRTGHRLGRGFVKAVRNAALD